MPDFFVSGATGMLGANSVRHLVKKGATVRILVRDEKASHPFWDDLKIERHVGDLQLVETLASGIRGCNSVIHCAGLVSYSRRDSERLYIINRTGTENMLMSAMAAGVDKFIHVSSTAAIGYSPYPHPLNENTKFDKQFRRNTYMHSKWLAEEAVRKASQVGFNVTIVCPSTICGAGDVKFNNGRLFADLLAGRLKKVPPGGNAFVSVDDVVQGIFLALEKGKAGERYILNSVNMSYLEFFQLISRLLEIAPLEDIFPKNRQPLFKIAAFIGDFLYAIAGKTFPVSPAVIDFSFAYRYFSAERAKKELGWRPRKSIQQACKEAITFYREHRLLPNRNI